MKNKLFFIILYAFTISLLGQVRYQFELDFGLGFQSDLEFNDEVLNSPNSFSVRFGSNVQIPIYNKIFVEGGVYGKYNRGSNEIEPLVFKSNSLRIQIPLYFGYDIYGKWSVNVGASVENNRDFDKIDFQKEYNLRYDFLTKIIYQQSEQFHYVLYTNWLLSKVPDYYVISNPKNGIYLGVVYQLKKKSKKLAENEK